MRRPARLAPTGDKVTLGPPTLPVYYTHCSYPPGGQVSILVISVVATLQTPSLTAFCALAAVDLGLLSPSVSVPPPLSLTNVSLVVDCGTVAMYQAFFCSLNTSFLAGAVEVTHKARGMSVNCPPAGLIGDLSSHLFYLSHCVLVICLCSIGACKETTTIRLPARRVVALATMLLLLPSC